MVLSRFGSYDTPFATGCFFLQRPPRVSHIRSSSLPLEALLRVMSTAVAHERAYPQLLHLVVVVPVHSPSMRRHTSKIWSAALRQEGSLTPHGACATCRLVRVPIYHAEVAADSPFMRKLTSQRSQRQTASRGSGTARICRMGVRVPSLPGVVVFSLLHAGNRFAVGAAKAVQVHTFA